jgi:hypothetical protein
MRVRLAAWELGRRNRPVLGRASLGGWSETNRWNLAHALQRQRDPVAVTIPFPEAGRRISGPDSTHGR